MELYLLDRQFQYLTAPIDDYISLTWNERYSDAGDFQLTLSPDLAREAMDAVYVMNSERGIMEITGVTYSSARRRQLTVSGMGLLGLLNRRIITEDADTTYTVGYTIANRVDRELRKTGRAFAYPTVFSYSAAPDTVDATCSKCQNLYEWATSLLERTNCGADITYDRDNSRFILRIYKGLDRTSAQSVNGIAVFSQSFGNIRDLEVKKSVMDYKNCVCAYDGYNFHWYNAAGGTDDRREMSISVSDVYATDTATKCVDAAAEARKVDSVTGTADQTALVYKTDYNLGDLCDVTDDTIGMTVSARVTEVSTIYEKGAARVIPSFGNRFLNLRDYIDRRMHVVQTVWRNAPEPDPETDE